MRNDYYWDINDLINDYNGLKYSLKHINDGEDRIKLKDDMKYIKENIIAIANCKDYGYSNFNIPFSYINNHMYYKFFNEEIKDINNFHKNYNIANILGDKAFPLDYKSKCFTNNEVFTLTHDFYKSIDKDLYDTFLKHYNKRFFQHSFEDMDDNYDGITYYVPVYNKCYTKSCKDLSIKKLMVLIHEEAHVISYMLSHGEIAVNYNLTDELESIFMEFLAVDYFKKIIDGEEFDKYRINELKFMSENADIIINVIDLIKSFNSLIKGFKNKSLYLDFLKINYSFLDDINYLYSYLVSIELYEEYLNDSDLALYHYKYLITNPYDNDNVKKILKPNEHLDKFCQDTIK